MLMLFDYNHYFIFAMILGAEKLSYGDGESRLCLCWVKTVAGVESGHQHQPGHHQTHSPAASQT